MNFKTFKIWHEESDPASKKNENLFYKPAENMFQDSFVGLIVGKPGSGKTTLIEKLLGLEEAFLNKFHIFLVISPTMIGNIKYHPDYWTRNFSVDWIVERLTYFKDMLNEEEKMFKNSKKKKSTKNNRIGQGKKFKKVKLNDGTIQKIAVNDIIDESDDEDSDDSFDNGRNKKDLETTQEEEEGEIPLEERPDYDHELNNNNKTKYRALIIIDDRITELKQSEHNTTLQSLFFNRRGIVPDVCTSYLITSQTFKRFPLKFRNVLTFVIVFGVGPNELKAITSEHVYGSTAGVIPAIQRHFKKSPHNFIYIRFDKGCIFLNFETIIS